MAFNSLQHRMAPTDEWRSPSGDPGDLKEEEKPILANGFDGEPVGGFDFKYSFEQNTGDFTSFDRDGSVNWLQVGGFTVKNAVSYSGADGYQNNSEFQNVANIGVIPRGMWNTAPYPGANLNHYGPYASRLSPISIDNPSGRSGFLIHWDTGIPGRASQGCIILPTDLRQEIYQNPGRLYVH